MNINLIPQSFAQPSIAYFPIQQQQLQVHHHHNAVFPRPVFHHIPPQHQKCIDVRNDSKISKYDRLQKQIDNLFDKVNQMDKTINQISTSYMSSPQKNFERENESTKYYSRINQHSVTPNRQHEVTPKRSEKLKESSYIQEEKIKDLSLAQEQFKNHNNNQQSVKEQISRIELMKGVQFGQYVYFGELNNQKIRHGYGTLYDLKGRIIYTGQWCQDQYHDRGKLFFYDLNKGSLKLEMFQNYSLVSNHRISYTGQFSFGQMNGLGQMLFMPKNNTERFIFYGRFENGIFNGRGTVMHYFDTIDSVDSFKMMGIWQRGLKV